MRFVMLNTLFPRLEHLRSINFILVPRCGLYDVCTVIEAHFIELGQEHTGMHVKPIVLFQPAWKSCVQWTSQLFIRGPRVHPFALIVITCLLTVNKESKTLLLGTE